VRGAAGCRGRAAIRIGDYHGSFVLQVNDYDVLGAFEPRMSSRCA